jgi:HEAT repeat protein
MKLNLNLIGTLSSLLGLLNCASLPAADLATAVRDAAQYESGASAEPLRQIEQAVREAVADPATRADVEAALIKLLAPSSTFEARRFACTQLAFLGSETSLSALTGLLNRPETTGMACLALGSCPSAKVNPLLRESLAKATGPARLQILVTLGDRRDPDAVRMLVPLTRSPDDAVCKTAIASLGKIASAPALEELAALRQKGDPVLARATAGASLVAADLVAQSGDVTTAKQIYTALLPATQPAQVRRAALSGLLRLEKEAGEERILQVLRGKDAALKPVAIAALRPLQSKEVSARFAKEMASLQPPEQLLLIEALASRNDEAALAAISSSLSASNATVRRAAASALGSIGNAGSVPMLAAALAAAEETEDRQAIVAALVNLKGGEPVDQALASALAKQEEKSKPALISVLGKRASRTSVPALLELAGGSDAAVAKAASQALGKIVNADDLPALLDRLGRLKTAEARSAFESTVAQALARTQDPARRSAAVCGALDKATDLEVRSSLLGLLPSCGNAPALETLKAARADQEPRIREAALRAMAEWPDASATDPLLEMARTTTQDTERVLALRGAVRLLSTTAETSPPDTAARFQKAMDLARNADEKKLVLGGLGRVHDPAALKLAESCLGTSAIQAEAALAAVSIAPYVAGSQRDLAKAVLQKVADLPVDAELKQSAKDLKETIDQFADYLTAWQVSGPYNKEGWPGKDLFGVDFQPEQEKPQNVSWQVLPVGTDKKKPWLLDLGKFYGGDNRVAYARAWVHSEAAQPARLELGSDDGIQAWLNGKVVLSNNRGGDVAPAAEKAEINLQAGWNGLLLKVTQWSAGWGFCARVAKPDGARLEGLRVSSNPPETPGGH